MPHLAREQHQEHAQRERGGESRDASGVDPTRSSRTRTRRSTSPQRHMPRAKARSPPGSSKPNHRGSRASSNAPMLAPSIQDSDQMSRGCQVAEVVRKAAIRPEKPARDTATRRRRHPPPQPRKLLTQEKEASDPREGSFGS